MRKFAAFIAICAIFLALLAGCYQEEKPSSLPLLLSGDSTEPDAQANAAGDHPELTIWSFFDLDKTFLDKFAEAHPDVKIHTKTFAFEDALKAYIQSFTAGNSPDLFYLDNSFLGAFSGNDLLQDTLTPPFSAGKYRKQIADAIWESALSIDGKKLLAMPVGLAPAVTFYRADILAKYGFPTNPVELGNYIAHEENWLGMGKELKKHGIYIDQWDTEPMDLFALAHGLFDRNLNYQRDNDVFARALNISRNINRLGLDSRINIWNQDGNKAVSEGKFAMVYMGSWGEEQLKAWAPETSGLWRVTFAPFGQYGNWGSTLLAISSTSRHKELAWDFIETQFNTKSESLVTIPGNLQLQHDENDLKRPHPFLGDQPAGVILQQAVDNMPARVATPLDQEAEAFWKKTMSEHIFSGLDTKTAIHDVQSQVTAKFADKIDQIRNYLHGQNR
ncbi:MAG TPA: extracellular solute-binding protein [Bacilli bacterium]